MSMMTNFIVDEFKEYLSLSMSFYIVVIESGVTQVVTGRYEVDELSLHWRSSLYHGRHRQHPHLFFRGHSDSPGWSGGKASPSNGS